MFLEFPKEEYYQWDTGQAVKLTADAADVTEVHMWNNRIGGPALVQPIIEGENGRYVEIPDVLFVKAGRIILWGVTSGKHGCCTQTEHDGINVLARPKPTDYAPGKVETLYYKQLLERLDDMLDQSAYELAVKNGFEGSEEEWLESLKGGKGDDGKSAYEAAVENGFEGSEGEWLESLRGGSAHISEITLYASDWVYTADESGYHYSIDVAIPSVTAAQYPIAAIHHASHDAAKNAELCSAAQTLDGAIRFRAKHLPSEDMTATVALLEENDSSGGNGGGSSGGGGGDCNCADRDLTDAEFNEMMNEIFSAS